MSFAGTVEYCKYTNRVLLNNFKPYSGFSKPYVLNECSLLVFAHTFLIEAKTNNSGFELLGIRIYIVYIIFIS